MSKKPDMDNLLLEPLTETKHFHLIAFVIRQFFGTQMN